MVKVKIGRKTGKRSGAIVDHELDTFFTRSEDAATMVALLSAGGIEADRVDTQGRNPDHFNQPKATCHRRLCKHLVVASRLDDGGGRLG